jgi:hypothetical protein
MTLFTIGFTKKTARQFFETLKVAGVKKLIDIRLNNRSQLAGFTKKEDLEYFVQTICRVFERRIERLINGDHSRDKAGIASTDRVVLTISLGEPFSPGGVYNCYKLVAAVLVLPK